MVSASLSGQQLNFLLCDCLWMGSQCTYGGVSSYGGPDTDWFRPPVDRATSFDAADHPLIDPTRHCRRATRAALLTFCRVAFTTTHVYAMKLWLTYPVPPPTPHTPASRTPKLLAIEGRFTLFCSFGSSHIARVRVRKRWVTVLVSFFRIWPFTCRIFVCHSVIIHEKSPQA